QAGITTPAQDRLHFAAFDLSASATRADLIELLKDWSSAAAALCLPMVITPADRELRPAALAVFRGCRSGATSDCRSYQHRATCTVGPHRVGAADATISFIWRIGPCRQHHSTRLAAPVCQMVSNEGREGSQSAAYAGIPGTGCHGLLHLTPNRPRGTGMNLLRRSGNARAAPPTGSARRWRSPCS
ncbi:MAG: Dyp-type peroxidase, partial [Salinibacterium sp.]|nr:Dyp-type peroxidase [Salinibacterium sp.]